MLAKAAGVSLRSVQRILEAHQLAPHRIRTFKLSTDPKFAEKLKDVVGLYVDPPAHAVVLSVDEKSQIQALDRTQPGLPIKPWGVVMVVAWTVASVIFVVFVAARHASVLERAVCEGRSSNVARIARN